MTPLADQTVKLTALGAAIGCPDLAPGVEDNRGTTLTDLEQSVIRAEKRAKLFRETTRALLPEFAHLIKKDGDQSHVPHDCLENLNLDLVCGICGARYEKGKGIHLVGPK